MKERTFTLAANLFMWLSIYFAGTYSTIVAIGFFVFCDMITGSMASYKRGEKFSSSKLKNTVFKFIAYGIAVFVAHVIEKQFIPDFPSIKIIGGFIAYIELKSINENIEAITGINLFGSVIKKFKR